ncbi:MAG TPA: DUF3574 domain-containing protein [Acetobacteraceae bacterium]|nr:DUF3574 domain-containing protein [Acetobacteraceae bacterium]
MLRALACCVPVFAGGCSQGPAPLRCGHLGGAPMLEYQLFFGRGSVTDQQWADFTANAVTPNLPNGFTALDTEGQWMNPTTHRIIQERGKVILVIMPDTAASAAAVAAVKNAYLDRFHQQSVGNIIFPVCGAF